MKKFKLFKLLSVSIGLAGIFGFLFAACGDVEIGLGSAVDTEAAKLTVHETPRAGDVVRGSFILSGICTDDTEIESFTITFENTAETDQKIEFSTTPDKTTGEWALIIDPRQELTSSSSGLAGTNKTGITPETQMVPDGEYQVTFKVIDQVKHETIVTRQFKIDNTPPVIVIERPSSKKDAAENSIDSYGQSFTLEGQSADDNDVKTIEVRVYDEVLGQEEASETSETVTPTPKIITLNNVPSRINMDIAKYVHGEENDYSQIYGSTEKSGSKKLYCELIAYDSAVRYPIDGSEQTEEDLKGNKTDFYYLLTDISMDILSKYKITDVYHMLSGTYKATGTDSTERSEAAGYGEEYVKKYLSRTEKKTAMGSFTLNPENSPSFTVMGRAQLKTEGKLFSDDDEYSDYKVTNETTLMIEVSTGLDSIPLLTEENCVKNIGYAELYVADPENNRDNEGYVKYLNLPYSQVDEETGLRQVVYKFRPYFIECNDEGIILNAENRIYSSHITKKVSGLNHQFSVEINKEDGFQYKHNYKVGVEGLDESGNTILDSGSGFGFRFVSKGMLPTITINEPNDDTTRLKAGETIKFTGTVSTEDGIPELVFSLKNDNNESKLFNKIFSETEARVNEKTLMLEYDFEETIGKEKFDQNESQEYSIILRAYNDSSNIKFTEVKKTILYDVEGPNINITDIKPVINNGGHENSVNKTITVKGNMEDDFDSVSGAEWKLTQKDSNGQDRIIKSGNITTTVFGFPIDTTEADDKKEAVLTITARDKAGNERIFTENLYVDQATDIPTITPSDPDGLTFDFADKNQLIQGNKDATQEEAKNVYTASSQILMDFKDDDGIEKIEVTATADPGNYGESLPEPTSSSVQARNSTEYTYAYKAPAQDGYYTIYVKVTDNTGVYKEQSFSILVSGKIPEVKISTTPEFVTTNTQNIALDAKKRFTVKGVNSGTTPFQYVTRDDEELAESVYVGTDGVADSLKVKWTDSFTPPAVANGTTTSDEIVYRAFDAYGIGSNEVTFEYKIDNTHPTAVITRCLDPSTSQGTSFRFVGTSADDENGSGVLEVQIRIDNVETNSTSAQTWEELSERDSNPSASVVSTGWINASGTDNWNCQVVFDDEKYANVFSREGKKVLYVRVTDVAGNYNEMKKQEFEYDKADPVLTVDETSYQRYMGQGGYTLRGTASDTNGLKTVKIYETKDNNETENSGTVITVGANGSWNVVLPLGINSPGYVLNDGRYKYVVEAEDIAGNKKSSNEYETVVDITRPLIGIEKPAPDSIVNETRSNFNGTISDSNGIKYVWYKILAGDSTAPTVPESSSEALLTSTWNGWSLANTGTTVWDFDQTFSQGSTGAFHEGNWTLYMTAVDNAGMVSELLTCNFDVDMTYPSIETRLDGVLLDESMTQTKTESYSFKYKITETYGLMENYPEVIIKKDNVALTEDIDFTQVDGTGDDEGYKLINITSQADGLYEYTITAKDLVNKETRVKRNILLDTTAPEITVTSPVLSGWQNVTTVKVNGSAEDKSGTYAVWYSFGAASMPAIPTANTKIATSWTGWRLATGTTSWNFTLSDITDGTQQNLYIAAVDSNGAVTTGSQIISAIVKVDATNPSLTETGIGAGTQYKNAAFILSGTAEDNGSGLASLTVSDGTNTWPVTLNTSSENPATIGSWTLSIAATYLSEGTNTYTITATDNAGRVTTESRTVVYDITKPVVSTKSITTTGVTVGGTTGNTWYNTNQIGVSIIPNDPNSQNGTAGSGVTQMECSTDRTSWTVLSTGTGENAGSYVGNITCPAQGENTIYIRITDRAGNTNEPANGEVWTESNTITAYIDTQNPTFTEVKEVKSDGSIVDLTGVKLVTGRESFTFCVNAGDIGATTAKSGLATVKLTGIDGVTKNIAAVYNETTGKYHMTIATADMPGEITPVNVKVTVTDNAGNSDEINAFQLQKDNVYPLATVGVITDADNEVDGTQVNGIITVSGTASDTHTLTNVKLQYSTSTVSVTEGVTTWSDWSNWTDYGTNYTGTPYNWSYEINTTSLFTDESKVRFRAIASDEAGNSGNSGNSDVQYDETSFKEVYISQKTDRPVIRLSNLSMSGMTSSSPVWINSKDLFGTISDDDGEIQSVKILVKDSVPTDTEWSAAVEIYNRGSWSYKFDTDGVKQIYFRVVDARNKTFISNSTTNTTFGPKIMDSVSPTPNNTDNSVFQNSDILYVKVDTVQPVLTSLSYYASATEIAKEQFGSIPDSAWTVQPVSTTAITEKFGGTKRYLYFKYSVYDINGVNSVKAELDGTEANQTHHKEMNSDATSKQFISYFDIRGITTGNARLTIKMKDHAAAASTSGTETPSNFELPNLDNASPSISFSNYQSRAQVYGSSSVTLRGTTSDSHRVTKVQYALTDSSELPFDDDDWIEITNTEAATYTNALGWQIVFDGNTAISDTSSFHAPLLKSSLVDLYGVDDDEIKAVYVWIRAVDELGNDCTNIEEFIFYVIPNGDRPSISISYPTNNSSVGGSIRITGSTEIQDTSASIDNVYIQIDPSYNETEGFNANWATELQELMSVKGVTSYSIVNAAGIETGKGISSQGTSKLSWYLNVNANKELNSKVNNGNRVLGIRAFAVSSTGKVSGTQIYKCEVDPEAPVFGQTRELRFVQYSDNAHTVESASRRYESNISLKGQWYLVGSVEDESGIRQVTLNGTNVVWTTGEGETTAVHNDGSGKVSENDIESSVSPFKNYDLKIPVGSTETDKFGEIKYEIETTDGSDSQASNLLEFTVSYDNKKPDFVVQTGNGVEIVNNSIIRQSNGAYTVAGTYAEPSEGTKNQSGFSRIAMFFTRTRTENGTTTLYLLDPMVNDGDDGDDNFFAIGTVSGNDVSLSSGIVEKEGLYWRTANATLADEKYLTVTGSLPSNVRAGGLCMVENVIYRIKSVSGTTLVLDGTLTEFSTAKEVYFALAQVIDNLSQESGTTTVAAETDSTVNGDGDCMIEGVQISGGIYNWNATLDSSNMLDGKVNMCFVAYDKAGNYTPKTVVQKISNNAPRISGVTFGADKDLNGSVSGDEMITTYTGVYTNIMHLTEHRAYNGQDANGNWITTYNPYEGSTDRLVIKGAIKVIPEIVGGNGGLGYSYTYKDSSAATKTTGVKPYTAGHSSNGQVRTDDLTINITLEDFLKNNIAEGTQNMVFNIWDKTDDADLGDFDNGSEKAAITLPVNVLIADTVPPTAVITPLYWEKAAKNSIYLNNVENGHIELESELPGTFTAGATDKELDRDAKVSGKITFEVTAEDNVIVNEIKVAIAEILPEPAPDEDPEEITSGYDGGQGLGNEFTIAGRNESGTWESANYNTSLSGNSATDWSFELVNDEYNEETGKNTVKFKFHFDTSKVTGGAAKDIGVSFIVYDKGSPERIENAGVVTIEYGSENDSEPGFYRIDVVPYITKVYTSLAKLKSNNWSVYNRTALGHYPAAVNEEIVISGFNLTGGTVSFESSDENAATVAYDVDGTEIPANAKTGKVSITVSGVESLNNKNNNDSKGSYTGSVELSTNPTGDYDIYKNYYYNRQPNGDNNNLLTDDVVVDVWEINSNVAQAQGSAYIAEPIMKINPVSGMLNFAFNSGPANFSMANGTTTSYTTWLGNLARMTAAGFTIDEKGETHGITVGLDTNPSSGSAGRMQYVTSKWGQAISVSRDKGKLGTQGNYEGTKSSRFETIGAPAGTYNGITYSSYIFMEDRFASPSIVTSIHEDEEDTEHTYVFVAYYDDINAQIRFRYGDLNDTTEHTIGRSFGGFQDAWVYGWGNTGDGNHKSFDTNTRPQDFSVIAASGVSGNYVSIDLIKGASIDDDVIVATWQDSTSEKWYYAYKKKPCTDNDVGATIPDDAESTDGYWSDPILLATNAGEDCHISVDPRGGVHLAAYQSSEANLLYAYFANYDDLVPQVVTVDSYAFAGEHLTLDTAFSTDGNYVVPIIGYYMSSAKKPKIARLDNVISATGGVGTIPAGVDSFDAVNGKWEMSLIPTESKYADNYAYSHVNVGVWKDSSGKIKNSNRPVAGTANVDTWTGNNKAVSDETKGYFWGNGTENPVLGYAIRIGTRGYIETAQMK